MNDIELCQELMKRAEEYQKQKEREFAIAELEKIKEEMLTELYVNRVTKEALINIVDNHISELKGENNEGKRICRNCKNFYEYDSVFDEEDNEDYFTLFCKVKGEVREPDEEIADKCKDFVLKGENND